MNPTTTTNANALLERAIQQAIHSWAAQNKTVTDFFNKHEDNQYFQEVAPGRNRGVYLLAHLIAANDGILPLFGLGERLFPQYEAPFLRSPDQAGLETPTMAELKTNWDKLNQTLNAHFQAMSVEDWMGRHTSVSEEDFAANPMRNKLNVLLSRTNHESYHMGQLAFLSPRK